MLNPHHASIACHARNPQEQCGPSAYPESLFDLGACSVTQATFPMAVEFVKRQRNYRHVEQAFAPIPMKNQRHVMGQIRERHGVAGGMFPNSNPSISRKRDVYVSKFRGQTLSHIRVRRSNRLSNRSPADSYEFRRRSGGQCRQGNRVVTADFADHPNAVVRGEGFGLPFFCSRFRYSQNPISTVWLKAWTALTSPFSMPAPASTWFRNSAGGAANSATTTLSRWATSFSLTMRR